MFKKANNYSVCLIFHHLFIGDLRIPTWGPFAFALSWFINHLDGPNWGTFSGAAAKRKRNFDSCAPARWSLPLTCELERAHLQRRQTSAERPDDKLLMCRDAGSKQQIWMYNACPISSNYRILSHICLNLQFLIWRKPRESEAARDQPQKSTAGFISRHLIINEDVGTGAGRTPSCRWTRLSQNVFFLKFYFFQSQTNFPR